MSLGSVSPHSWPAPDPLVLALRLRGLLRAGFETALSRHGVDYRVVEHDDPTADLVVLDPAADSTAVRTPRLSPAPRLAISAGPVGEDVDFVLHPSSSEAQLMATLRQACPRWSIAHPPEVDAPGRAPLDQPLSPREEQILALICAGLSNAEICARLYLGINTVKTYIRAAYRKMPVSTRSQAIVWGLEHGYGAADGHAPGTDPGRPTADGTTHGRGPSRGPQDIGG